MRSEGRPAQAPAANTYKRQSSRFSTGWFASLRRPDRPAARVPGPMRRLLPDPMYERGRQRFLHADVANLTPAEVVHELGGLRAAVALAENVDMVPAWIFVRMRVLAAVLRGAV